MNLDSFPCLKCIVQTQKSLPVRGLKHVSILKLGGNQGLKGTRAKLKALHLLSTSPPRYPKFEKKQLFKDLCILETRKNGGYLRNVITFGKEMGALFPYGDKHP